MTKRRPLDLTGYTEVAAPELAMRGDTPALRVAIT
jgi:hypothetical protein